MPEDGLWLDRPTELSVDDINLRDEDAKQLRREFHRRRNLLATHVNVWKHQCINGEIVPQGITYVNSDDDDEVGEDDDEDAKDGDNDD